MDINIRPGGPLAQVSRARIFALLAETGGQVSTHEVAERLALHPNGVRSHLERLAEAGLVERERERGRRGRPRDLWRVADAAAPGGDPPTAYADLSRWLARAITPGKAGAAEAEDAGRRIGRELAEAAEADREGEPLDPERRIFLSLVALGFQPAREAPEGDRQAYRLCNCPYRDAASERANVVCGLHKGLTEGMLEVYAPDARVSRFVIRDPKTAGCEIEVSGVEPAAADDPVD